PDGSGALICAGAPPPWISSLTTPPPTQRKPSWNGSPFPPFSAVAPRVQTRGLGGRLKTCRTTPASVKLARRTPPPALELFAQPAIPLDPSLLLPGAPAVVPAGQSTPPVPSPAQKAVTGRVAQPHFER